MKVFEFGLDEKDMKAISALNQNLRKIVPINKVKLDKIFNIGKFICFFQSDLSSEFFQNTNFSAVILS